MKKNIQLWLILLMILGISCENRLEVAPTQSISQEQALSTEKDVLVTLSGCYDGLQDASVYGGDMLVLAELLGNQDDIFFTGTFQGLSDVWQLEMIATNSNARETWRDAYITINRANNVLSALDKITSSVATKNRVEGEARFIRASMYFELVRMFAKTWDDGDNMVNPGVPLVLTPTISITNESYMSRNSVAEVYLQIISDLELAENLLPESNGILASKTAASAMLARVKLMQGANGTTTAQQEDLVFARDAANEVIESGLHQLASFSDVWYTYINNGGNSPSEYIFSMKVTAQDGINSLNTYFGVNVGPGTTGRADCKINDSHIDIYEDDDLRKSFFVVVGGRNYTQKHLDRYGNVPIIRLAEMYLTRAEANFILGTAVGDTPLNDINRIRNRAGLPDLVSVTLDDIRHERYLELAFEGSRIHDIKRTRSSQSGVPWNDTRLIFPIPQREIDTNSNLTQNSGY